MSILYLEKPLNSSTIYIRQETPSDFDQTQEVIRQVFLNVKESDQTEHLLVDKLRKLPQFVPELSLVAETANGEIIGHVLLTPVKLVSKEHSNVLLALAPLAVLPSWQRMGVGSALVKVAHRRATRLGYKGIVILGSPEYYVRFGYKKADEFGISMPFPGYEDYCLAIELNPNSLRGIEGEIVYPKAFFE